MPVVGALMDTDEASVGSQVRSINSDWEVKRSKLMDGWKDG